VITPLCDIWCWTFIKLCPTGSEIQKHMRYPTAQSDRNGHRQRYVHTHTGCWPGVMSPTLWVSDIAVIHRVQTKLLRQWVALMSSGIRCEAHITNTMASYWSQHFSERFATHRSVICRADTGSLGPKWSQILSVTISFYLALPPPLWKLIAWFINRMSGASGCRIRQSLSNVLMKYEWKCGWGFSWADIKYTLEQQWTNDNRRLLSVWIEIQERIMMERDKGLGLCLTYSSPMYAWVCPCGNWIVTKYPKATLSYGKHHKENKSFLIYHAKCQMLSIVCIVRIA